MPEPRRLHGIKPGYLVAGAAALLALTTVIGLWLGVWHGYLDLMVYRLGAQTWLDGDDLYGRLPPIGDIRLPFTYPPLAAIAFAPLALMSPGAASALMFLLSLAAIGLTCWLVLARVAPRTDTGTRLATVLTVLAFAEYCEPVRETLSFGQVNAILMAAVAFDVLNRVPRWPRGILIGIAISIKLTPAGFLLFFLLRRDRRALVTTVAAALASIGAAWWIAPGDSREYWFSTLAETGRIGAPYFAGNQSLKGLVFRLGLAESTSTILWLGLSALAVVLAAVWMRRLLADDDPVTALLVNAGVILLISPVSWTHHWVWVVPAVLVALAAIVRGRRDLRFVGVVAFVTILFYVGPHWLMPSRKDRELAWSWWQWIVGDLYALVTVTILIVGAWSAFTASRTTRPAAP
ncbi:MAG: glycosyltransferase 87 family protein [Gordonia sp. (in: high G+C Gram-positive bacteria)]|uniref:glycosyltransferase 87 family protein n=1 Tax=Gordonia sp. (in: high G+C Gram-positive bacteria) TaxID=84139 RepID=UPI0039E5A3BB